MMAEGKKLNILVQVLVFLCLTRHIWDILQKYQDQTTMTSPGEKKGLAQAKPMLFTVCRDNQFRYGNSRDMGYNTSAHFFAGNLSFNLNILNLSIFLVCSNVFL